MAEEESKSQEREKAMRAVKEIFDRYKRIAKHTSFTGFDTHLMSNVTILDATAAGITDVSFIVDSRYANVNGVMHGGAAGLIFDMCTTIALGPLSRDGYWDFLGGVTRSLNISYLKAVPVGTTILIHAQVLQIGRTMALIRGTMSSLDRKTVFCTCEHHKVAVPTKEGVDRAQRRSGWPYQRGKSLILLPKLRFAYRTKCNDYYHERVIRQYIDAAG